MTVERPNLDRMWETWIQIGPREGLTINMLHESVRNKIHPMISDLESRKVVNWYHFLFHPYPSDPNNAYFHVRFSVLENIDKVDDMGLPSYCVSTQKIGPIRDIAGIDRTLIEIEEAWRLIGKQSEWVIDFVRVHNEGIPIAQFLQFMHFFMNMMGLGHRAILMDGSTQRSF